jgi:hypothetical protein
VRKEAETDRKTELELTTRSHREGARLKYRVGKMKSFLDDYLGLKIKPPILSPLPSLPHRHPPSLKHGGFKFQRSRLLSVGSNVRPIAHPASRSYRYCGEILLGHLK